jgi:hypothetical protein
MAPENLADAIESTDHRFGDGTLVSPSDNNGGGSVCK